MRAKQCSVLQWNLFEQHCSANHQHLASNLIAKRFHAMNKPDVESLPIRFPRDIKRWLEKDAARNFRSQSSHVLAILKQRMEQQEKEASDA